MHVISENKYKREKANIIEIIEDNRDILDSFKKLYSQENSLLLIDYENLKIVFRKDWVIQKISNELEEDLILAFNTLGCKNIDLFVNESEGKVLEISLVLVETGEDIISCIIVKKRMMI